MNELVVGEDKNNTSLSLNVENLISTINEGPFLFDYF